jgi:hypothetical protein
MATLFDTWVRRLPKGADNFIVFDIDEEVSFEDFISEVK